MKTQKYQTSEERTILTALIVHDGVLEKVFRYLGDGTSRPFKSKWSNLVARWCFAHFAKYQRAPKKSIEGLFTDYAQSSPDQDAVELVEKFLGGLSNDYKTLAREINEDYLVDLASTYFDRIRLTRMAEAVQAALDKNDIEEAREKHSSYEKLDFSSTSWKDPFDLDDAKDVFYRSREDARLIEFPGDMGVFLSPHFKRGGFIAFAGPDKRGKSYWLQEVVWRALKQRRRILYYVLGDMSETEVRQRLYVRMVRKPWEAGEVRIPTAIQPNGREGARVKHKTEMREKVTLKDVARAKERLLLATGSSSSNVKFRCEGASVVTAGEIEQEVGQFAKQDWLPDVVVVDYADLLSPEPHTKHLEIRHQNNAAWAILRRIGLRYHCLVVAATQTAATAYSAWVIRKKDFSEDKRKNAHVTGMIGINQMDDEKQQGIYRLNWIVLRGGKWSEGQVLWTAGDLAIACPCIISSLGSK